MASIEQQYQDEIDNLKIANRRLALSLKEVLAVTAAYHCYDTSGRVWLNDARELLDEADVGVTLCTRNSPHVCKEKGPCNGWPKQ